MKTVVVTASGSSSRTPAASRDSRGGGGDSCYFPGCRKDANCGCEICLDSIHATRDLIPSSALKKLSGSTKNPRDKRLPPYSDAKTPPSSPTITSDLSLSGPVTPPIESTAKSRPTKSNPVEKKASSWALGYGVLRILLGLALIWAVEFGVPVVVSRGFEPRLTEEVVERIARESRGFGEHLNLKRSLVSLEKGIEGVVGGGAFHCSSLESGWEFKQEDHMFFHWKCVIYKSKAEELTVWGSPLRSSGLLLTGFSPRSLTILSGRITEWSDRKLVSNTRTSNGSSWTCSQWSTVALHLDSNTWVLEYRKSPWLKGPGLIQASWMMLMVRAKSMLEELKLKPWRFLLQQPYASRHEYITEKYAT